MTSVQSSVGNHRSSDSLLLRYCRTVFTALAVVGMLAAFPATLYVLISAFSTRPFVAGELLISGLFSTLILPQLYLQAMENEQLNKSSVSQLVLSGVLIALSFGCSAVYCYISWF